MSASEWESRGRSWWAHVLALADDSMEGRATGSAGYDRAAEYVVGQFRAAGLEPAGVDGYRQPVDFVVSQLDEAGSKVDLLRGGSSESLRLREDVQIYCSSETVPDLEAEAVFVGYGLDIPEYHYSDLADLDLRGKIAVYFRGGPSEIPDAVKAHHQSMTERLRALRKAGAVGSGLLINPKLPDLPWSRLAPWLAQPRLELKARASDEPRPLPLAMAFNWERFDRLLTGTGHTTQAIIDRLGGPGPIPRFPLPGRIRAHVQVRRSTARCSNVVGVLRGSDPALKNEYVVGTAHLDHLGIGEPIDGKRIYSGAMDNASGVATLIEIARALKDSGQRPKRSLLFVAVTGEEKGLLGSEYFAAHPTVPGPMVAELNMDMFLPLYPMKYLEIQGLEESSLGFELKKFATERGLTAHTELDPQLTLFIRSDQYNFIKQGIPSLMLAIGNKKGSPEETTMESWLRERYHSPKDDTNQPIDKVAAAQFTDLLGRFMAQVADDPKRPTWNSDSFFRRFAR